MAMQHKQQQQIVMHGFDIEIGQATVKADVHNQNSGWWLPGGIFTTCPVKAMHAAVMMASIIRAGGGLPRNWVRKEVAA